MAQKAHIVYESDLSGAAITDNDAPTQTFGWDGTTYELDLTSKEAEKFYSVMKPYLDAARKVKGTAKKTSKATTSGPSPAEVRMWAEQNGIDVPSRGRIPSTVYDAYNSAN